MTAIVPSAVPSADLSPACHDFLHWAERDRRRAAQTMRRYRVVLGQVTAIAGDPAAATREQVEAWWASRQDKSPATRANDLALLRTFYFWATRFELRPDDPTRRLDPPKVSIRTPRPIGEADVARLLGPLTENRPADRRAIALMVYTGMRVSEAARADWADIDQDARRIYITGKGDKQRVFGLSPLLLDKILPNRGGNIVNAGGAPTRPGTLEERINQLMRRRDIDHTCHDIRKRAATIAIATDGVDVYAVAKAFGWASVETASHYALVGDQAIDRIAAALG